MSHGGKRPGSGRPKGALNKATAAQRDAIVSSGLTPLEYMLGILRDEQGDPDMRFEAAKAAAPYVHPKLASTELKGSEDHPIVQEVRRVIVRPSDSNG